MPRIATEAAIAKQVKKAMGALGVYKPEFDPIIAIYAGMRYQYGVLDRKFAESDYDFQEPTAQGSKKAPIVTTIESLRKDIIAYGAQLGLTPAGLRKIKEAAMEQAKPPSPLDRLLNETQ